MWCVYNRISFSWGCSPWFGRQDSNLRPLGPKPSTMPNFATPEYSGRFLSQRQANRLSLGAGDGPRSRTPLRHRILSTASLPIPSLRRLWSPPIDLNYQAIPSLTFSVHARTHVLSHSRISPLSHVWKWGNVKTSFHSPT